MDQLFRASGVVATTFFCAGIVFFIVYNEWIIFCAPWRKISPMMNVSEVVQKKQIIHYYFQDDKWKIEKQEILWSNRDENNIIRIINAWLALLEEERILLKKITVQSVLISTAQCAYISFDSSIFDKQETIFKKLMFIQGLFKTLALNSIAAFHVQFLVHHELLNDAHLDFSLPWSIESFMK